ncbi:hypothetical protein KJ742_06520 [Patescibacteria group bacterium]|nr:hypothetical protein [Patescibacteria group bacterium]MBU1683566.1 hypothetical protein [Patescibacteria group bacterium]MBU1935655.1 hypothetical protein [Patescibacteria group bacterium]
MAGEIPQVPETTRTEGRIRRNRGKLLLVLGMILGFSGNGVLNHEVPMDDGPGSPTVPLRTKIKFWFYDAMSGAEDNAHRSNKSELEKTEGDDNPDKPSSASVPRCVYDGTCNIS